MSWRYVERCPRHGSVLQEFNGYGEPFRRSVCLDCRWESGKGPLIVRIIRRITTIKGGFLQHWGPATVFIRRSLTNRLNRLVGKRGYTLEEVAPLAGDSTDQVMTRLREFEEKRGSVRTKQSKKERKEQTKINNAAQHLVDVDRMLSLDDADVARAADWARYHETGGAKKRQTTEVDYH